MATVDELVRHQLDAYDASYPPSALAAAGAAAGIPGAFTPTGSRPPLTVADLIAGVPNRVVASPTTPWTTGQYVQTATIGAPGRATWTGTAWVGGVALDEATTTKASTSNTPTPEDV